MQRGSLEPKKSVNKLRFVLGGEAVLVLIAALALETPASLSAQSVAVFSSTNAIAIRDGASGLPYPSTIEVTNLPGVVSRIGVTLSNLSHAFPDDIDLLLVSESGASVILMSDVGGNSDLLNVTLTFDDFAESSLPDNAQIVTGAYKPTNIGSPDHFFDPAPAPPYGTSLSGFNGTTANGEWGLYVVDDAGSDDGTIAAGWSLSIETVDPSTAADLSLGMDDSPDPVTAGDLLEYTITITNLGPNPAEDVLLTNFLPAAVNFVSADSPSGMCDWLGEVVRCSLGTLASGAAAAVTIKVVPTSAGTIANTARVSASSSDFDPFNSEAQALTTVGQASVADIVATVLDEPDPVIVGQNFSYAITLTNRGPLLATSLMLSNFLSPNITFISVNSKQADCAFAQGIVTCSLDMLPSGTNAAITILARANLVGGITNRLEVLANEPDLTPVRVTNSTSAILPSDLSVRQTDSSDPASVGSNLTYTVTVMNNGPGFASGIRLTNTLPQAVNFIAASPSQGVCATNGGMVLCDLGTLPNGASAQVSIVVQPTVLGTYFNRAEAGGSEIDNNPNNNSSTEQTTVFPGGNGIVVTPSANPDELANAVTAAGSTGIRVVNTRLLGHTNFGAFSSGLFSVANPPFTYGLQGLGVVISSGNVLDYQTGPNRTSGNTTGFGVAATTNQEALLDPITMSGGRSFRHFDVTQLDITFDLLPGFDTVSFDVVFGSDEYPEFVNSSFVDGFGIYLNGQNIAFSGGRPVNINHPDMAALAGTELDGILAPGGNAVVNFTAFVGSGASNNTLTFIVSDTSDSVLDTTVYVSSLQGAIPPNADLSMTMSVSQEFTTVDSNIVYTLIITNAGPDIATDLVVSNTLPSSVSFFSAIPSRGSCSFVGNGVVICDIPNLDAGRTLQIAITGMPTEEGFLTNTAFVAAAQVDFVPDNNDASVASRSLEFGAFLNPTPLTLFDGAPAAPYPSILTISNFSGTVTQVSVALLGLSHSFPADLDVLLVGPGDTHTVLLMSDAGANQPVTDLTLVFDDLAASGLPQASRLMSGTYRPTNYDTTDPFPAPAPPGPYGSSLGVFNQTDPNGTWKLYVMDDLGGDAGRMERGWRLTLRSFVSGPQLTVERTVNGAVLSWPLTATGFVLEAAPNLSLPVPWAEVPVTPVVTNGQRRVTVDLNGAAGFYRLSRPEP